MFGIDIGFVHPWYLTALLLLPLLWGFSFRSLSGLGRYRRLFALAFRTLVFVLIVAALAEVQALRTSDKVTVTYLLDQSESIPVAQRQAMLDYVRQGVGRHRRADREDCAGVIVFGHDAVVEVPPFDDDIPFLNLEGTLGLRTDATNLAAALKMAGATFPEDSAKRVVIVSDGNENIGDARSIAGLLADQGIGIDVVPVQLTGRGEVQVDEVVLPSDIRRGQPIEARVVIDNLTGPTAENPAGVVRGKLKLVRQSGKQEELLNPDSQDVELKPGKNVFSFQHRIDEVAVYTYKASLMPDNPQDDRMQENNLATAFTHVRGKGRVLLIEDADHKGGFDYLISRLQANNLEVTLQSSDSLFTSLAELQAYDCVVLANVPQSSGADANTVTSFSDEQITMLVRNTEQFGCGLVMLGGENSFGAGGWANTRLERAMPVDFHIENARIRAVGALVMIMHASEIAEGNYWQKVIAREAIKPLGPMDYCGLIHWGPGREEWLWREGDRGLVRIGQRRNRLIAAVERMTPGDMPEFDPAMKMALGDFNQVNASVKHMIIISDGDPSPPSLRTVNGFVQQKIKISTVAVGAHGPAGHQTLKDIASATGGQYYVVKSAKALPRIFQIEARRVARPLVKDLPDLPPRLVYPHEMLQGLREPLPPLSGFVMTTVKKNPLVEVALVSPDPPDAQNATILAGWTFGLGRSVAWTTDAGQRWANAWTRWENYDKLFSQMIRWAMRPVNEEGKFSVATDVKNGRVRVVVTALDKDDQFLNFLNMSGVAVDPDLKDFQVTIEQVAPGRYVGEFAADKAGSYFVNVVPGAGKSPILAGVTVPYSSEFRDRETNVELLRTLAAHVPQGGQPGQLIEGDLQRGRLERLLDFDTFRHNLAPAISRQDIWPLVLLVTACVFFCDVLIRRVTIRFDWLGPAVGWLWARVLRRPLEQLPDERLKRLRSRKAEVSGQLEERRAAARFEPQAEEPGGPPPASLEEVLKEAGGAPPPAAPPQTVAQSDQGPAAEQQKSYTERLLEAKKKAWKDK
ncbi:MAG: VWA domain-containing protein [Candidatus Anammoximicrobium sp.]|nr:VWA domain-containing protein [Candidatus Anammoximicrobium sp.]